MPGIVGLALNAAGPNREIIETELRHGFKFRVGKDSQSCILNKAEIGEFHAEAPNGSIGGRGHSRKTQARLVYGGGAENLGIAQHALLRNTKLSARRIVEEAMKIACEICIYTNANVTFEELE